MSKYTLTYSSSVKTPGDELCHYGVLGMKWGVRRATEQLRKATTKEERDKAVASLNKHREKASKQITKLAAKRPSLDKAYNKAIMKTDVKIAKMQTKKSRLERKASGFFTSNARASKLLGKAAVLDMKINKLKASSNTAKAAMAKNERMTSLFKQGMSDIDAALASAGRKYVNG